LQKRQILALQSKRISIYAKKHYPEQDIFFNKNISNAKAKKYDRKKSVVKFFQNLQIFSNQNRVKICEKHIGAKSSEFCKKNMI
jgi:hypothetical protein